MSCGSLGLAHESTETKERQQMKGTYLGWNKNGEKIYTIREV